MRRGDGTGFAGLRSPFVWVVIVALVAGVVGLGALLVATSGGTRSGNGGGPSPSYAQPGPFAAGVTTVALPYGPVEVWYPVEHAATAGHARDSYDIRDWLPPDLASRVPKGLGSMGTDAYRDVAPSVHGPFPLVLFAHGLYSFRDQSTFLTSWLASWGFVVAAPEFTTHDLTEYFLLAGATPPAGPSDYQVLFDTEQLLFHESAGGSGRLHDLVRPGKIGVVGHSLGGLDAIQFASRPEVAVYVALAAGNARPPADLPAKASLYMTGSDDHDVEPAWVKGTYLAAPSPKKFVSLPKAGHLAFTDLCLIARGQGGVGAIGSALRMNLPEGAPFIGRAVDGCAPGNLPAAAGFSIIRQVVTAELESTLLNPPGSPENRVLTR
jgi:dienelactone hydrolase